MTKNSPRFRDAPTRPVARRSESTNSSPTTFIQTDTASFKAVVQMLTGFSNSSHQPNQRCCIHSIPPIHPNRKLSSSLRLNERRNSMTHRRINPTYSGSSTGNPDTISPSILDFPSLVLSSPVMPLIPHPVYQSESSSQRWTPTPRNPEPQLLSLFPLTPGVSDSTH